MKNYKPITLTPVWHVKQEPQGGRHKHTSWVQCFLFFSPYNFLAFGVVADIHTL